MNALRNAEQAIAILTQAEAAAKPDFLPQYFKGLALERADRLNESLTYFEKAVALSPTVPEVHYEEAKPFLKLGNLDKASEEFERTISLDPKHAGAFYQLSILWQRKGDPAKAQHRAALSCDLLAQKHRTAIKRLDEKFRGSEWKR